MWVANHKNTLVSLQCFNHGREPSGGGGHSMFYLILTGQLSIQVHIMKKMVSNITAICEELWEVIEY